MKKTRYSLIFYDVQDEKLISRFLAFFDAVFSSQKRGLLPSLVFQQHCALKSRKVLFLNKVHLIWYSQNVEESEPTEWKHFSQKMLHFGGSKMLRVRGLFWPLEALICLHMTECHGNLCHLITEVDGLFACVHYYFHLCKSSSVQHTITLLVKTN